MEIKASDGDLASFFTFTHTFHETFIFTIRGVYTVYYTHKHIEKMTVACTMHPFYNL